MRLSCPESGPCPVLGTMATCTRLAHPPSVPGGLFPGAWVLPGTGWPLPCALQIPTARLSRKERRTA